VFLPLRQRMSVGGGCSLVERRLVAVCSDVCWDVCSGRVVWPRVTRCLSVLPSLCPLRGGGGGVEPGVQGWVGLGFDTLLGPETSVSGLLLPRTDQARVYACVVRRGLVVVPPVF